MDDLIELEAPSLKYMRSFLARFVIDEATNQPLPREEALSQIGRLKLKEIRGFIEQVSAAVAEAVGNAVPPTKSGR